MALVAQDWTTSFALECSLALRRIRAASPTESASSRSNVSACAMAASREMGEVLFSIPPVSSTLMREAREATAYASIPPPSLGIKYTRRASLLTCFSKVSRSCSSVGTSFDANRSKVFSVPDKRARKTSSFSATFFKRRISRANDSPFSIFSESFEILAMISCAALASSSIFLRSERIVFNAPNLMRSSSSCLTRSARSASTVSSAFSAYSLLLFSKFSACSFSISRHFVSNACTFACSCAS
mmetsp:Transcript_5319/g.15607  ORF Transcript_5319/g.15607 Transcript_5319/m.15607 type:complete len:242 (+) Transcript_5319:161-886(+)